jgi:hypothetical protein
MLDATALVHEAYRGWLAPNNRIKQWDSLVLCQLLCADMDQVAVISVLPDMKFIPVSTRFV